MRILKIALASLTALVIWTALVIAGAREGWWRPMPAPRGNDAAFVAAAKARYERESKGNIALVLIDRGRVAGTYFASHGKPVGGDTLFQVASMSKWLTAWGVMALADSGRIDLDAPVSRYLKRWKLPPSQFDNNQVTVRRLLSHTAGLTDGLGFRGFAPGQKPAGIESELTRAPDAMPFTDGVVRVGLQPGSAWRYSGGGYLILQLLIEDVTGEAFNDYMRHTVLLPLGMRDSTFVAPDQQRLAEFFDADGKPGLRYTFTAVSAASLYTSTNDMTRFLAAQGQGPNGEPAGRGALKPQTVEAMRQPQAFLFGLPIWGLGNILYMRTDAGGFIVGHDGNNYPAINTTARVDPATGDGIVVLETGNGMLASEIGADWIQWRTGRVDFAAIVADARTTMIILAAGALTILLAAAILAWRGRRRRPS